MEEVYVFKLITGEEILAQADFGDIGYMLINPVRIAMVPGKDGQPNIGFAPWPVHAEQKEGNEIAVQKKDVVYYYTPAQEYINNYNQIFGAGIVLPPTKQIITG